jgi:hypothetical protein
VEVLIDPPASQQAATVKRLNHSKPWEPLIMPLSENFMAALLEGHLSDLHRLIVTDRTLCPEIREDTLTIYYRGKALLRLARVAERYVPSFDANYCLEDREEWYQSWVARLENMPELMDTPEHVRSWIELVPTTKAVMDRWMSKHGGLEREAQQLIVQENNRDGDYARATDYYFCDMERAENQVIVDKRQRGLRFDLVGVHWPSTASSKKKATGKTLVIAEAKYGDGAHAGEAGLVDHFQRLQAFIATEGRLAALKEAMVESFKQKHALELIECQNPLESFSDDSTPLTWLIILINHDPEKSGLLKELEDLRHYARDSNKASIRIQIAMSNFMGYGLWDQAIVDLDEFLPSIDPRLFCR